MDNKQFIPQLEKLKCVVRSYMLEPQDAEKQEELGQAFFKDFLTKNVLPEMLKGDSITIPTTLLADLTQGNELSVYEKEILKYEEEGWFTCLAYMYFCRAIIEGDTFSEVKYDLNSKNKCLHFISGYAKQQKQSPFSADPPHIGEKLIEKALGKMWPVAHYWAAEFCFAGKKRRKIENAEDFNEFMMLAEKYRLLGLATGIYKGIAAKSFNPDLVMPHPDYQFEDDFELDMSSFTDDEMRFIRTYISE